MAEAIRRLAAAAAFLALGTLAPAAAQDARSMEAALAARRAAAGYLRTHSPDLALTELEALERLVDGDARRRLVRAAIAAAEGGDFDRAGDALARLGDDLADERRRRGVRLLADCVREFASAFARLDVHRTTSPDLAVATVAAAVAREAQTSRAALLRCDAEAPAAVEADPEFRRLVDGGAASFAAAERAATARDPALLHRYLIELRSIEQLVLFRFG
jgi:hypothetical protein